MQAMCDAVSITLNKNSVLGDKSALTPGGVRIGSPALTTRGFKEEHFRKVGEFLHRAVNISIEVQKQHKLLKDFTAALPAHPDVIALKKDCQEYVTQFPMPGVGFGDGEMKYKSIA